MALDAWEQAASRPTTPIGIIRLTELVKQHLYRYIGNMTCEPRLTAAPARRPVRVGETSGPSATA